MHDHSGYSIATATPPTLKQMYDELATADPGGAEVYYALTEKNKLPADAIVATPEIFGKPASPLDPDHGKKLTDALYDIIANAETCADLTALGGELPGGAMKTKLQAAIKKLAESGRQVTVRLLFGQAAGAKFDTNAFLKEITSGVTSRKLSVYVAQMNATVNSWNHAKILAADGKVAMVGGHNWYETAYLGATPICDLSIKVEGPVAKYAQDFANRLWKFVADNNVHGAPWVAQPKPEGGRVTLRAFGPAFLVGDGSPYAASAFVLGSDGALWEHAFYTKQSRWDWISHGQPNGKPIVALGPRMLSGTPDNPERITAVTSDGWLWERIWNRKQHHWVWNRRVLI